MPRIRTKELIEKIESGGYKTVTLRALGGARRRFCMMIEDETGRFLIHENLDSTIKEYPSVDHATEWLRTIGDVRVIVDKKIARQRILQF